MGVEDSADAASQLGAALHDGLEQLNKSETFRFQGYSRVVLPLDGYVFWLPSVPLEVEGSLHYSQDIQQNEDETVGLASVTFTTAKRVVEFSEMPINSIFVATVSGFRFAFARQKGHYSELKLWHYSGISIYPALATQLIDDPKKLDPEQAVVSNSLPFWLQLANYKPPFYDAFRSGVTLYPSDLVPPNLEPPYGSVEISDTPRALQSTPLIDINRNHSQLVSDRVRIILYGLQNNAAMDFVDAVNQYSVFTGKFRS